MNERAIVPDPPRPDPDAVLARVHAEAARQARGRLRIYFGASAGVGKTYAMLAAALRARGEGRDVVVGLVETHGRSETAALLEGLEVLPRREMPTSAGRGLQEFDLDAALARRPSLLLVDELAHSNAPGCRHPKRWQDVQELLDAGIEVHSTLNVQHLESLNAVVGGITGIRVMETVPDTVLEAADEVVLVDVTADELLARLAQGKVYLPQQAERAAANFFRKGNLIALRELALRRVAERVGGDVEAWRTDQSIDRIWQTGETILAAVGPGATAEHTVRGAARWANRLETGWQAVYVETPALQRLPAAARERILQTLKLAGSMGARTEVLSGPDVAAVLAAHARAHNVGRIAIGRRTQPRGVAGVVGGWLRRGWRPSVRERLSALVPEIDLIELSPEPGVVRPLSARPAGDESGPVQVRDERRPAHPYAWTGAIVVAATLAAWPLSLVLDLANVVMVFLSAVVLVAYRYGRGPSVMASVLGVALFDFFFVSPQLSFAVSDVQYLVTFAAMLAVGLVTGQLTAGLRYQATVAADREARSRELYELARELSGALLPEQIETAVQPALERILGARSWILLPGPQGRIQPLRPADPSGPPLDIAVAQWCFDKGARAGLGTDTLAAGPVQYLPLKAPMQTRGVLAIAPARPRVLLIPERQRQLDTIAHLIAIAVERIHYVEVAQAATLRIEGEQLRNSLLSAISHDLRTPLTALVGWADVLVMSRPPLGGDQARIARSISDEARRTGRLVENLLEMARLQSGGLALRMQWHSIEEIVGASLESCRTVLGDATIRTSVPEDLPLVRCDAVLIERVLANLLENAVKYGVVRPPGAGSDEAAVPVAPALAIDAVLEGDAVAISVSDRGPGLPAALVRDGDASALFDTFTRGERESSVPGLGLGLSICRAIVEAHGGRIEATDRPGGGARFVFRLPVRGVGPSDPPPAGER